jgi:hypothetical protein
MKWFTFFSIIAVFLMGILTGAFFGVKMERDRLSALSRAPSEGITRSAAAAMSSELQLNVDQKEKLHSLLEAARPELEAAETARRERVSGVIANVEKELDPVLTPPQRQRGRSFLDRLRRRFFPESPRSVPVTSGQR